MDHTVEILIEKLLSSGCELDGGPFRKPFVNVIKGVLSDQIEINANEGALDTLLTAMDASYHEDIGGLFAKRFQMSQQFRWKMA